MSNFVRMSSSYSIRPPQYGWPAAQPVAMSPETAQMELKVQAEQSKNAGNEFRKLKMFPQAVAAYENAIRINPRYTDAYFNLSHLMMLTGNVYRAIGLLNQLLWIDPNDHDARVTMGEYYEKAGNPNEAKRRYLEVLRAKPDFDPANRRLQYLLYLDQRRFSPQLADELMRSKAQEVVHKSRELLRQFYTVHHPNPVLLNLSQSIPIEFSPTQQSDEIANIAEYDARRNVIRVHPQMMFSTPNVVAAYLAHEMVHAVDGDSHTSIMEEQDGYRELARFWNIYQAAENEPNLDRALELYLKSQDSLDHEVRRVYSIRDAGIPEKSPGHGQPPQSQMAVAYQAYELQQKPQNLDKLKQLLVSQPKFAGKTEGTEVVSGPPSAPLLQRYRLKVTHPKTHEAWEVCLSGSKRVGYDNSYRIQLTTEAGQSVGYVEFDVLHASPETPVKEKYLYGEPAKAVNSLLYIAMMRIRPEFTGKGVKEALIGALQEESIRLGFKGRVKLQATNLFGSIAAIPWYKAGFRPQTSVYCDADRLEEVKRLLASIDSSQRPLSNADEQLLEGVSMYFPLK